MTQITLNTAQVNELADFIKKHSLETFFLAKDEGAYVGACGGSHEDGTFENVIFYFRGMNPKSEAYPGEASENARDAFGGDDFGEHLDASFILKMAEKHEPKVTIKVTATQIKVDGAAKKAPAAAPKPAAPKPAAPKAAKSKTKGEQIRELLAAGVEVHAIVKMVGTTENSVRWHKSKMAKAA